MKVCTCCTLLRDSTDLLQAQGLAAVGQSFITVWEVVYTVVSSGLGVLQKQ